MAFWVSSRGLRPSIVMGSANPGAHASNVGASWEDGVSYSPRINCRSDMRWSPEGGLDVEPEPVKELG